MNNKRMKIKKIVKKEIEKTQLRMLLINGCK